MGNEFVVKNEYAGMEDFAFDLIYGDAVESSTYLAAAKCAFNPNLFYCSSRPNWCCTKPNCAGACTGLAD